MWNVKFPLQNGEMINLDWILREIKKLTKEIDEFKVVNYISFSGLWTIEKAYQRWTIVDTPDHTGYISIKPVPIGVNIDNEDYWRQVANYSELYADVQNRIIALEEDMEDAEEAIGILNTDVTDLDRRVSNLENNTVIGVVVGDSYTTYDPLSGDVTYPHNFGEILVDQGYLDEVHSYGVNGSRYTLTSSQNFKSQLEDAAADDSFDNDEVSYVIIEGGQNERFEAAYGETNTFYISLTASVKATIEYAMSTFPNAKVVVVPIFWDGILANVNDYHVIWSAIYDTAADLGALYDKNSVFYGRGANYTWGTDHVHPTYDTLKVMVRKTGELMQKGICSKVQDFYVAIPAVWAGCTIQIIDQIIVDGLVHFKLRFYNNSGADIAAGSDLAYVYPQFSKSNIVFNGPINSIGDSVCNYYIHRNADTKTGEIRCYKAIANGENVIIPFTYAI